MSTFRAFGALGVMLLVAGAPARAQRSAPRAAPVIAIDPGHPSEVSSGGVVQHGTTEVHSAWVVARRLERQLRARGYRVVLTKSSEREMVRNVARAEIANRAGAALAVRLHCDATSDSGFAVYYRDRAGTAQGRTGPREDVRRRSAAAAESLHVAMARRLAGRLKDGGVRGDSRTYVGSRQGALTGSVFSEVPVVLVEMVTLSNARDARFIKSPEGQELMALAVAEGIARYVPPPQPTRE